jgi:hypothetical protein
MTKKHFIALADSIRNEQSGDDNFTTRQLDVLADFCAWQNPKFNRERWLGYIAGTNGENGGKR